MSQENKTPHPAVKPDILVNSGALQLALNSLKRGSVSQQEIAAELESTAITLQDWHLKIKKKIIEKLKNKKQQLYSQPVVTNIEIGNGYTTLVNPDTWSYDGTNLNIGAWTLLGAEFLTGEITKTTATASSAMSGLTVNGNVTQATPTNLSNVTITGSLTYNTNTKRLF